MDVAENFFTETKLVWPGSLSGWENKLSQMEYKRFGDEKTFFRNDFNFDFYIPKHGPLYELITEMGLGAKIFRLNPHEIYSWHRDRHRKWALNMLFEADKSVTLFSTMDQFEERTFDDLVPKTRFVAPVHRLVHEAGKFYLLNGHTPHMVFNDDKVRYLITVSKQYPDEADADLPENLSYADMKKELEKRNLI